MSKIEQFLNNKKSEPIVSVGFDHIPQPIVQYVRSSLHRRPAVPHLYHVTALCRCLGKSYLLLRGEGGVVDVKGLYSMFRGTMFDRMFCPLFPINQRTYTICRDGVTITGTLDFVYDGYVWDLKMPGSVYYSKQSGVGDIYRAQVKSYLMLAHQNNELLDITKAKILQIAEDVVVTTVDGEDSTMLSWLMDRAVKLDHAMETVNPMGLSAPLEPLWECKKPYCPADDEFQRQYCVNCLKF